MIAGVGGSNDAACDLLLEHLQAARRYLLGSMPGEYNFSLQQARKSVAFIPDETARTDLKEQIKAASGRSRPENGRSKGPNLT